MKKCPQTASGKHLLTEKIMIDEDKLVGTGDEQHWEDEYYPQCELCDFVDDRKKLKRIRSITEEGAYPAD